MRQFLCFAATLLTLSYLWNTAHCCGRKAKKLPKEEEDPNPTGDNAISKMLGENVEISQYENSVFESKDGKAQTGQDLSCNFDQPCCWKNSKPPYDTMEWAKGTGHPDPERFQQYFKTTETPTGNFLLTMSDRANGVADKAEFQSCAIPCSDDNIQVTLKHWATDGVKIQVCEVSESDASSYLACQDLTGPNGQPETVSMPPGNNVYLAIVAGNLISDAGNMAIIQDIQVNYPQCSSSTSPPETTPPTEPTTTAVQATTADLAECQKLKCNFEQGPTGLCNYKLGDGASRSATINFVQAGPGRYKNPATGVAKSPDGTHYAAAYLTQKERYAYMEVESNFDQERTITFQEYKATEGVQTRVCCGTLNDCPFSNSGSVDKRDFNQWYKGACTCPAGTKKLIIYAENTGNNEGGVGIDNIIVVTDKNSDQEVC